MLLRDLLTGGTRQSVAQAGEALEIARQDRAAVDELARLTDDPDVLVVSRACYVLEKLLRELPEWVRPHKHVFLGMLASPYWEVRLQCVRAIPLLDWTSTERPTAIEALRKRIDDDQKFVRCWALNSFALMAVHDPELRAELDDRLAEFLGSGVPSMQARAREIAKRIVR